MMRGLRKADVRPPVADDRIVHIMIFGGLFALGAYMVIVEPALKKRQLTRSEKVPKTTNGNELISKLSSFSSCAIHH